MIFAALFPVVNPIGTALVLFGMTRGVDDETWKSMSRKMALYSFLFLTFSFFRQLHPGAFWNFHPGSSFSGGMAIVESK
jgi:small neutral amino acid transporter SnatA (MarC family)